MRRQGGAGSAHNQTVWPRQERASEGSRHSFPQWRRTFFNKDRFHLTDKDPPIRSSVWEF